MPQSADRLSAVSSPRAAILDNLEVARRLIAAGEWGQALDAIEGGVLPPLYGLYDAQPADQAPPRGGPTEGGGPCA